ncbi:DUF2188 domain-containing protein [Candidatus Woesearchaeota archaeon]|nr:DUF2188 domain-containing protein [Candidatus Woesearchaeota archaeon]
MEKTNKHVVPRENGWAVRTAGGKRVSRILPSKEEAMEYAANMAEKHNVCMVLHDKQGFFDKFECDPGVKSQHVVPKSGMWGVVTAKKGLSGLYETKGKAMAHAYDVAVKDKVCMLVHGTDGKIKSVTCPPDETPSILEVVRMKIGV